MSIFGDGEFTIFLYSTDGSRKIGRLSNRLSTIIHVTVPQAFREGKRGVEPFSRYCQLHGNSHSEDTIFLESIH